MTRLSTIPILGVLPTIWRLIIPFAWLTTVSPCLAQLAYRPTQGQTYTYGVEVRLSGHQISAARRKSALKTSLRAAIIIQSNVEIRRLACCGCRSE